MISMPHPNRAAKKWTLELQKVLWKEEILAKVGSNDVTTRPGDDSSTNFSNPKVFLGKMEVLGGQMK